MQIEGITNRSTINEGFLKMKGNEHKIAEV
jgi:hypothetical protein